MTLVDAGAEALETTWETDPRGSNHYQSPSWYRYVGEDGGSHGDDWLRFYHPDDRAYLEDAWRSALDSEGRHRYDIDVRIRRHDGAYRWFRVHGEPVRDADGRVTRWVGRCTPIDAPRDAQRIAPRDAEPSSASLAFAAPATARPARRARTGAFADAMRFGPLQRRLFLIVLVGLLPLAALSLATLLYSADARKRERIEAAGETMRALLTAVDTEITATWAALDALAASPRIATGDLAAFHDEARELLGKRPGWANVVLSTPEAQQLVNVRLGQRVPLPSSVDAETVGRIAKTGVPQVGTMVFGPAIGTYGFAVGVPVRRGDGVGYVLMAPSRPDAIREILDRQRIPASSVVAILDRGRNVVARSRNHEQFVGKPGSATLLDLIDRGEPNAWSVTRTLEGEPVYTVVRRSELTGWYAAAGIPLASIDAPIVRAYVALGGSLLLSVLVGLGVALLTARSITRPMRELEAAADAVSRGEPPQPPRTALPEVRNAAAALIAAQRERESLLAREREAREQEREARVAAETASRAKDEFLAMLGHELRNPLAAISTAAEILDRVGPDDPQGLGGDARAIIGRQVRHLRRLTDDLLDAGRVMMGKIVLERAPVDLAALVDRAVATMRSTGRLREHALAVQTESAWIDADATRIEQVVGNLLVNAVKYTPPGGHVEASVAREGGFAVLRVRDDGIGLEPELLPRIFDLFVQGRRSLDRAQGGLGIGLTLVRRLVELHGGSVEASSDGPDRGSTFVVRLPAIEPPPLAQARPRIAAGARRIVVVEDNDDARRSLRQLLELGGHAVHEAADGPSGLATIVRERPDVALVDVGLPGFDGYAVARGVRRELGAAVRLVALTGYGQPEDRERAADAGFDDYFVKPVDPAQLAAALASVGSRPS